MYGKGQIVLALSFGLHMTPLTIDPEALRLALQAHDESEWYLDRRTGEIIAVPDPELTGEPDFEGIHANPDRFVWIEPVTSEKVLHMMRKFVETLEPASFKHKLNEALDGERPFRAFHEALENTPPIKTQWQKHEDTCYREIGRIWLEGMGIVATLQPN